MDAKNERNPHHSRRNRQQRDNLHLKLYTVKTPFKQNEGGQGNYLDLFSFLYPPQKYWGCESLYCPIKKSFNKNYLICLNYNYYLFYCKTHVIILKKFVELCHKYDIIKV